MSSNILMPCALLYCLRTILKQATSRVLSHCLRDNGYELMAVGFTRVAGRLADFALDVANLLTDGVALFAHHFSLGFRFGAGSGTGCCGEFSFGALEFAGFGANSVTVFPHLVSDFLIGCSAKDATETKGTHPQIRVSHKTYCLC